MSSITIKTEFGEEVVVDLDDFSSQDVINYAHWHFDMIDPDEASIDNLFSIEDIVLYLENEGFSVLENYKQSILEACTYDRLLRNTEKIPLQELESLLDKYNCL